MTKDKMIVGGVVVAFLSALPAVDYPMLQEASFKFTDNGFGPLWLDSGWLEAWGTCWGFALLVAGFWREGERRRRARLEKYNSDFANVRVVRHRGVEKLAIYNAGVHLISNITISADFSNENPEGHHSHPESVKVVDEAWAPGFVLGGQVEHVDLKKSVSPHTPLSVHFDDANRKRHSLRQNINP